MDVTIRTASALRGALTVPADKAVCHRAVIAGALASGDTLLSPWPQAEDCQQTLSVIEALGVAVRREGSGVRLQGAAGALHPAAGPLACGESGTTLRLMAGVLAGQPFASQLDASPSLRRRPMRRVAEPLRQMGAVIEGSAGQGGELFPPLTIHGHRPLNPIRYELPVASAQVKSAVLLAGLSARGRTTVVEPQSTRDHTERILQHFGVAVRTDGRELILEPGPLRSPGALTLPGDVSSAAFFIVAALCVPGSALELHGVGLNPTRLGFVRVLERMGARLTITPKTRTWEPQGTVAAAAQPLRGVTLAPAEVPAVIDELPILMVAAACADGQTRLQGIGELRVKETDRIQSMLDGLTRLGARVRPEGQDGLVIDGGGLTGAAVESAGDHRTAMALAVAALAARGETQVRDTACVTKSYPEFFEHLTRLAGAARVQVG